MSIFLDMDTTTAAQQILEAMRDLNAKRITPDECRARFRAIKSEVGEAVFAHAQIAAVVHDARG